MTLLNVAFSKLMGRKTPFPMFNTYLHPIAHLRKVT